MKYPDVLSIHQTAERCKAEGIPLPEKAIRRFVKDGSLPAIQTGAKALIYFPNVIHFIKQGTPLEPVQEESGGIRRIAE